MIPPVVEQLGAYEVVDVVDRAVFKTCTVHGFAVEHSKIVLNNSEFFFLCDLCFPKINGN